MTGSKSILAETVHNSMDTLNQGILILGTKTPFSSSELNKHFVTFRQLLFEEEARFQSSLWVI